jgi:hypothetical protein
MDDTDPHIHVEAKVVRGSAALRDMMASTFGLVADLPSRVSTGCGLKVPFMMTSSRPGDVTCLACREHAHDEHLRFADMVERLGRMPGSTISAAQAKSAAEHHRDLARKFHGTGPV